jgi:hypothetical protein
LRPTTLRNHKSKFSPDTMNAPLTGSAFYVMLGLRLDLAYWSQHRFGLVYTM